MNAPLLIAWRFIGAQRRAMVMGVMGVALGVAFFILTQAQTSGFEKFFIKTILGSNGAIRIAEKSQNLHGQISDASSGFAFQVGAPRDYVEGVDFPEQLRQSLLSYHAITGISEVVEGKIELLSEGRAQPATVNGIRLSDHLSVSALGGQLISGSWETFQTRPAAIAVGSRLAKRLELRVGQKVMLRYGARTQLTEVSGIFQTGVSDIDSARVYLPLALARSLLGRPTGGAYLQLSLSNPQTAPVLARSIESATGYHATSWQEREKVWLDVFGALKISAGLTVCSILAIAAMGIFNTLAMMALEKLRQMAIVMAFGFTAADVRAIFLWQGGIIGAAGILLGALLGAMGTIVVENIPLKIRGIFATDHFVVNWDFSHYLWAVGLASVAVAVATIYPAWRAGRLHPAEVLRGGAQ